MLMTSFHQNLGDPTGSATAVDSESMVGLKAALSIGMSIVRKLERNVGRKEEQKGQGKG